MLSAFWKRAFDVKKSSGIPVRLWGHWLDGRWFGLGLRFTVVLMMTWRRSSETDRMVFCWVPVMSEGIQAS